MPEQIPEKMQAVVCHGPNDYRLEEVAVPQRKPGEALIRVEAVGICASDLKCYHGGGQVLGVTRTVPPGPRRWSSPPATNSSVASSNSTTPPPADGGASPSATASPQSRSCPAGSAASASVGSTTCASPHDLYGFKRRTPGGAMAGYMTYPVEALVHKISGDIPPAHAAFVEPLSCSLHAVERAQITFEDTVVVAGCGPIGLGMIAGARAKNPMHVIALDMRPRSWRSPRNAVPTSRSTSPPKTSRRSSRTSPAATAPTSTWRAPDTRPPCRRDSTPCASWGRYVEYGVFGSDVTVDWSIISDDKELDVLGAHLGPYCWPAAIKMIESGVLPLDEICTHQLPLSEFQKGLDLVGSGKESVKVSLIPA